MIYQGEICEIQMASEIQLQTLPSLGSQTLPLVWSSVCVFVFVSSVCELQIMPAPPNVALQLPHFGQVPSNRNHKNQKTTDKVTGSWKCLQCPSLQTLQISPDLNPHLVATRCKSHQGASLHWRLDRLWQAMTGCQSVLKTLPEISSS